MMELSFCKKQIKCNNTYKLKHKTVFIERLNIMKWVCIFKILTRALEESFSVLESGYWMDQRKITLDIFCHNKIGLPLTVAK